MKTLLVLISQYILLFVFASIFLCLRVFEHMWCRTITWYTSYRYNCRLVMPWHLAFCVTRQRTVIDMYLLHYLSHSITGSVAQYFACVRIVCLVSCQGALHFWPYFKIMKILMYVLPYICKQQHHEQTIHHTKQFFSSVGAPVLSVRLRNDMLRQPYVGQSKY